jgi:ATP-binding cassette subfamily B protein
MPVILITAGGLMVIRGELTLGELVTFNGLMWAISNPLNQVGGLVNDFQKFRASGERLHELFLRTSRIVNPPAPRSIGRAKGRVEFRNVSFSYGGERVLKDIDFVAEPGMTVGILGPTGSGKSTIAKLICRYYDVTEGAVLLDGYDVRELDLKELRRNAGMAMQDVFLFSDTIEGNIAFGRSDAGMDEIRAAARLSAADDFIADLAEGYDTIVGERGVGLSGGQRQRIALARLLLADPPVMILDDISSSVDVETEERIRSSLQTISGGRTMFVIAHRVSALASADLILVMQDGRIVDRGRHSELIGRSGYYRDVWIHQSSTGALVEKALEVGYGA